MLRPNQLGLRSVQMAYSTPVTHKFQSPVEGIPVGVSLQSRRLFYLRERFSQRLFIPFEARRQARPINAGHGGTQDCRVYTIVNDHILAARLRQPSAFSGAAQLANYDDGFSRESRRVQ